MYVCTLAFHDYSSKAVHWGGMRRSLQYLVGMTTPADLFSLACFHHIVRGCSSDFTFCEGIFERRSEAFIVAPKRGCVDDKHRSGRFR